MLPAFVHLPITVLTLAVIADEEINVEGVEPAHGVYRSDAPALRNGPAGSFFKTAAIDLWYSVQHMAQEVRHGRSIPTPNPLHRKKFATSPDVSATMPACVKPERTINS